MQIFHGKLLIRLPEGVPPSIRPSIHDFARYHTCDQHQAWDEIRGAMAAVVRKVLWFGTGCCRLLHEKMAAVGGRPCCEPQLCWSHSRWGWIPTMLDSLLLIVLKFQIVFIYTPIVPFGNGWRLFGASSRPAWKIRQTSRSKGRKPLGLVATRTLAIRKTSRNI